MEISQKIYESLQKFPYLCNLSMERKIEGEDCSDFILKLEFCDFPNYSLDDRFEITFSGVQNLKLQNLDGLLRSYLVVRDLSDRQMENIKYYVEDGEEEMYSFYCTSIEMKEV